MPGRQRSCLTQYRRDSRLRRKDGCGPPPLYRDSRQPLYYQPRPSFRPSFPRKRESINPLILNLLKDENYPKN